MRSDKKNINQHLQKNFCQRYHFLLLDTMATNSFNQNIFNQISVERLIRDVEEEEMMRLLKQMVENNQKISELQKKLAAVIRMDTRRKRRDQDIEYIRRDYKERYEEKEQRKRQEEKDKIKDQEEQDRIEKIRIREERKTEKEQRQQKVWKRKKEQNREIVM